MTDLLKRVLEVAGTVLPDREQNELAQSILEDIQSELAWDDSLQSTYAQLRMLADAALADHNKGQTKQLDTGEL